MIKKIFLYIKKNLIVLSLVGINIFLLYKSNYSLEIEKKQTEFPASLEVIKDATAYFHDEYAIFIFLNDKNCDACNEMVLNYLVGSNKKAIIFTEGDSKYSTFLKEKYNNFVKIRFDGKKLLKNEIYNPLMLLVHKSGLVLLEEYGDFTKSSETEAFFERAKTIMK